MTPNEDASGAGARRDEELARIRERVAFVLSKVSSGAALGPDDDLAALGMDSMARLELLAQLEQEFAVELTEDLIPEFRTVNRIARIIRGALAPANPGSAS
ncbi:MAG: phosphopantetheine-binding protein [Proteobacteria bacterium]|jgi:acyl carrier protein|nr:phosphopantetheine-binding protein [Pseudomonadota bacterium]